MPMVLRANPEPIRGVRVYSAMTPRRSFFGNGFLAGDPPNGLVTINNSSPLAAARVRVLLRDEDSPYYGTIVAETYTDIDGRWIVDDLDENLRYNVTVSKEGFNDLIVANVAPVNLPRLKERHFKGQKTRVFSATLQPKGGSGAIATTIPNAAQLPAGLSYSGGTISGTISGAAGEYRVLVHFSDDESERTEILTIEVAAAPPIVVGYLDMSQVFAVGAAMEPVTAKAVGGVPPYIFSMTEDSPAWMDIDAETGEITGTLIEVNDYAVTVQVEDADGTIALSDVAHIKHDPYRGNVVFHAPFFSDLKETVSGNTLTKTNSANYSATGGLFGKGCAKSNNNGRIYGNLSSALGTDDFTIEFWLKPYSGSAAWARYIEIGVFNGGWVSGELAFNHYFSNYPANPFFGPYNGPSFWNDSIRLPDSQWSYLTVTRNDTHHAIYINGNKVAETTTTKQNYPYTHISIFANTNGGEQLNGDMCDLRITKGVARYTSNFPPPTAPHPLW